MNKLIVENVFLCRFKIIMNRCRLLYAVFAGTIFYVLTSMLVGPDGLWARKQMLEEKRLLSVHKAEIEKINAELVMEKNALLNDRDVLASYARKLGYIYEGEKLVKITGLPEREVRIYDAGLVVKHSQPKFAPEKFCKSTGFVIGIVVYLVLFLYDYNHGFVSANQKKRKILKNGVLYDLKEV